jgi:hypothetical protein
MQPFKTRESAIEFLVKLCGDNQNAASLIVELWNLVEVWDDALDKDHREPDAVINRAFLWAIAGRDENPFLMAHPELRLALKQMVAVGLAAHAMEKTKDPKQLLLSYTLRCSPYFFFISVVVAAAGVRAGAEAALYLFGTPDDDTFEAYMAEHKEQTE